MEEIKFRKSYCIDWKTVEEKINMEQVRGKIKENGLEDFIGGEKYNKDLRHSFRKEEPMWTQEG